MKHLASLSCAVFATGAGLLASAGLAQTSTPYKTLETIKTPGAGNIDYVYADSEGRRVYVPRGAQTFAFDLDTYKLAGTIAGVGRALRSRDPGVRIVLADPYGSALFNYIQFGRLEAEGDSDAEGIGIKRITANFRDAPIDDAVRVDDRTMVEMAHWLVREEGLFVGGSAALNVAAAARYAATLPAGSRVVTILCDGGDRYRSRLYNRSWLEENGVAPGAADLSFL